MNHINQRILLKKVVNNVVCKNCGHADNADHNASVNIKNRFTEDVLRKSTQLHSFDEYGRMLSCSKNKYLIKDILLSVFDT